MRMPYVIVAVYCAAAYTLLRTSSKRLLYVNASHALERLSLITCTMPFQLPPLPYALNALEPHMSQKTLEFHYGEQCTQRPHSDQRAATNRMHGLATVLVAVNHISCISRCCVSCSSGAGVKCISRMQILAQLLHCRVQVVSIPPHVKRVALRAGKHHQTYLDNMNKQIAGSNLESKTLEEVIKESWNSGSPTPVFNNAAQVHT